MMQRHEEYRGPGVDSCAGGIRDMLAEHDAMWSGERSGRSRPQSTASS